VRLTLTRPDDWHVHLRDGELMARVLPATARSFARAIVMPNLKPPVSTVAEAAAYRERILAALPPGLDFTPLMTLYLTSGLTPDEVRRARASGFVQAVKLYPAGATTHSEAGVQGLEGSAAVLQAMEDCGLPLLIHGEVTDPQADVFDRERHFLEQVLAPLRLRHPGLRIVLEHITTAEAADFVMADPGPTAATITAHHLLFNRNAMFSGADGRTGLRPHHYCLPVLKRERHRAALVAAATGGNPRFFLGTDSAPHPRGDKESACGCAGCFTAPVAMALYAEAFEQAGALARLEGFASFHGPDFYGLPRNAGTLTLERGEPADTGEDVAGIVTLPARTAWRLAQAA
jgi:dihydroorotase